MADLSSLPHMPLILCTQKTPSLYTYTRIAYKQHREQAHCAHSTQNQHPSYIHYPSVHIYSISTTLCAHNENTQDPTQHLLSLTGCIHPWCTHMHMHVHAHTRTHTLCPLPPTSEKGMCGDRSCHGVGAGAAPPPPGTMLWIISSW